MMFRKKPETIDAMQFDGTLAGACALSNWAKVDFYFRGSEGGGVASMPSVHTLSGAFDVSAGDWVIRTTDGDFIPCQTVVFETLYEPVEITQKPQPAPRFSVVEPPKEISP